ncbi:MAG: AsmA family protein [Caulobacteraceae bacterium]|nr:AsmA family protein [Caulobacteraceae bacterium]
MLGPDASMRKDAESMQQDRTALPGAQSRPAWHRRHRGLAIGGGVLGLLVLAIVVFLLLFDWNWLRGPIGRYASARTGRAVRLDGDLKVHLLSWTPTAMVGGLKIGNPAWAGPGDTATVDELTLKVKLLPLFAGRVELPLVDLEHPRFDLIRDAQDDANWRLSNAPSDKPAKLPPIQDFIINDGRLTLKDARRNMTLTGTVNARENAGPGHQGFELVGQGSLNKEPFLLKVNGGPLVHVEQDKPYPFHLDVTGGTTHILADGILARPFNLGDLSGQITAKGANLANLYFLTGIVFPATPPYSLDAHFDRKNTRFDFSGVRGSVGDSDLEGSLTVDKVNGRRKVMADMQSRRLVFSDLLAVIGGGPKASAVKTSAQAPSPTSSGRLLPDAQLYKDRLRVMDADVRYRARSVKTTKWPLSRFALDLKLNDGLLTLDPVEFDFPQGRLAGRVRIDGRKAVPETDMDVRVTNVAIQQFVPGKAGQPPIEGTLEARAQLHGLGDTIHKAASSANGKVVLVAPHGKIRQAFAELLGINVANGLYLLLSKDQRETDLRCAVAQFDVKNGVMSVSDAVFDTSVVRATGKGVVNLATETLDLRLEGQTKKPRLLRLWAPITLKGTLLHPKVGVDAGKVAGQVGIAAAVGAVLAPLAAILPFVGPALAKDADCAALLGEAKAQGAPVKASTIAAAAAAPRTKH